MKPTVIDTDVLRQCRALIALKCGGLDDFPKELANTFANIYYAYLELLKEAEHGDLASYGMNLRRDVFDSLKEFSYRATFVLGHIQNIPAYVDGLRQIRHQDPELYRFLTELYLDILKYRIERAHEKSPVRRKIERLFARRRVREIPNLIDFL